MALYDTLCYFFSKLNWDDEVISIVYDGMSSQVQAAWLYGCPRPQNCSP